MASRIPHLLEPHLSLPAESSLVLLTGVLGASTNWLVLRYLYSFLASIPTNSHQHEASTTSDEPVRVVLLSFLRDYAFWKDNVARLGVDLDGATKRGRFVFVDGLTGLFTDQGASSSQGPTRPSATARFCLTEPTLPALRDILDRAVSQKSQSDGTAASIRTVLVIDQLDLLVAAAAEEKLANGIAEVILDIRQKVYSTIFSLSADEPLIQAQTTPLEKKHASLVLSMAHAADLVMSVRLLDTGSARDVSGVLRITAGGSGGGHDGSHPEPDERELLYHIGGDGAAKVFERGQ